MRAVDRTEGVQVNHFDEIITEGNFLMYAVSEFRRYATSLDAAIQTYHKEQNGESDGNVE